MCINPSAAWADMYTDGSRMFHIICKSCSCLEARNETIISIELGHCPLALELGIGYLTPVLEPRIIDEGKPSGLAPTIRCPETEADHNIGSRLVHLGERFSELTLGNVGTPRVEYVHYL